MDKSIINKELELFSSVLIVFKYKIWTCCKRYLNGGDVKGCCYAKHRHDDCLVLLVDIELHVPNVLLSRHLGNILVGHIRLSGPKNVEKWECSALLRNP